MPPVIPDRIYGGIKLLTRRFFGPMIQMPADEVYPFPSSLAPTNPRGFFLPNLPDERYFPQPLVVVYLEDIN